MKVAIVTESFLPSINGVTNSVLRVIDTLLAGGHELLVTGFTLHAFIDREGKPVRPPANFTARMQALFVK